MTQPNTKIELGGRRFFMLAVIKQVGKNGKRPLWLCKCDCGRETIVDGAHLRSGHTKSCGCYALKVRSKAKKTHGMSGTKIYKTWGDMLHRCYNKADPAYKNYGARGIVVCKRWHRFENFFIDMGERPLNLFIERRNNDKGYSKDNCYWATRTEQNRNKRNVLMIEYHGKKISLPDFADLVNQKRSRIYHYFTKHGEQKTLEIFAA